MTSLSSKSLKWHDSKELSLLSSHFYYLLIRIRFPSGKYLKVYHLLRFTLRASQATQKHSTANTSLIVATMIHGVPIENCQK